MLINYYTFSHLKHELSTWEGIFTPFLISNAHSETRFINNFIVTLDTLDTLLDVFDYISENRHTHY